MADGRIVFDLPIWSAEIYHTCPGATNPWTRAFNVAEIGDEKVDSIEAIKVARDLFEADGLSVVRIYAVVLEKLLNPDEGGDEIDRS